MKEWLDCWGKNCRGDGIPVDDEHFPLRIFTQLRSCDGTSNLFFNPHSWLIRNFEVELLRICSWQPGLQSSSIVTALCSCTTDNFKLQLTFILLQPISKCPDRIPTSEPPGNSSVPTLLRHFHKNVYTEAQIPKFEHCYGTLLTQSKIGFTGLQNFKLQLTFILPPT